MCLSIDKWSALGSIGLFREGGGGQVWFVSRAPLYFDLVVSGLFFFFFSVSSFFLYMVLMNISFLWLSLSTVLRMHAWFDSYDVSDEFCLG